MAPFWDVSLMEADRLSRGWNYSDVAERANASVSSVTRFIDGKTQTPAMAKKIAEALGFGTERYLRPPSEPHPLAPDGQLSFDLAESVGGR